MECEGVTVKTVVKKDTDSAKYENGGLFYVKKPQTSMLKLKVSIYSAFKFCVCSVYYVCNAIDLFPCKKKGLD